MLRSACHNTCLPVWTFSEVSASVCFPPLQSFLHTLGDALTFPSFSPVPPPRTPYSLLQASSGALPEALGGPPFQLFAPMATCARSFHPAHPAWNGFSDRSLCSWASGLHQGRDPVLFTSVSILHRMHQQMAQSIFLDFKKEGQEEGLKLNHQVNGESLVCSQPRVQFRNKSKHSLTCLFTWVGFKHMWDGRSSHRKAWTITTTSLEDMDLQSYSVAGVWLRSGEAADLEVYKYSVLG